MKRLLTKENLLGVLIIVLEFVALHFLLKNRDVAKSLRSIVNSFHVWPSIPIVILILLIAYLFRFNEQFRKLVGEHRTKNSHRSIYIFFVPLLALFSLYYLLSLTPDSFSPTQQLSIIVLSVAFAALPIAIMSVSGIQSDKKPQLLGITQKFIVVAVLFTIFIAVTYLLNQPPFSTLNFNYPVWNTINGWVIAVSFLIESLSFFGSIALFILGASDLVFTFADLRFLPNDGQQPPPVPPNPVQPDPIQPNAVNPTPSNVVSQIMSTSGRKPNDSVKPLIWGICFGGVALSLLLGILVKLKWPSTQIWSVSLSIELGGLAISFPLIYLLVERSIKVERRNMWKKVRSIILNDIRTQTAGILLQIEIIFSQSPSVMDFATSNDSAVREAKHLSTSDFEHDWIDDQNRLNYLVTSLDNSVNSLVWIISHYSSFLNEEPNLFEKILDVKNKRNNLNALSSYRSINANNQEFMRPEQSTRINQALKQLLAASIVVADEINRP